MLLAYRLHLQERSVAPELDRHVGLEDADIVEQRAEPVVGFDDAFQHLVGLGVRQIGNPAYQKAPARRGLGDASGPDLQLARLNRGREERWAEAAHIRRGELVEVAAEIG